MRTGAGRAFEADLPNIAAVEWSLYITSGTDLALCDDFRDLSTNPSDPNGNCRLYKHFDRLSDPSFLVTRACVSTSTRVWTRG